MLPGPRLRSVNKNPIARCAHEKGIPAARKLVLDALWYSRGVVPEAASILGTQRMYVYQWINVLGLLSELQDIRDASREWFRVGDAAFSRIDQ